MSKDDIINLVNRRVAQAQEVFEFRIKEAVKEEMDKHMKDKTGNTFITIHAEVEKTVLVTPGRDDNIRSELVDELEAVGFDVVNSYIKK